MSSLEEELRYYDFRESNGIPARSGQTLVVHYRVALDPSYIEHGPWLESTWEGEPIRFVLGVGQVLKGIDEGLQGMKVAAERRLYIPPRLAFGERGIPGRVPPNATLIFDVYVVKIED